MFRQIAPDGVVKKEAVDKSLSPSEAMESGVAKVEIDQTPRAVEGDDGEGGLAGEVVEGLVEATGCPFKGTDPRESVGPFVDPRGREEAREGCPFSGAKE